METCGAIPTQDKIDALRIYLAQEMDKILEHACREGSMDYFKIEVSNHNGKVQIDYFFRERSKIY